MLGPRLGFRRVCRYSFWACDFGVFGMILSAQTIRHHCVNYRLIEPFSERTKHLGKTFGLSSAGYDVRVEFGIGRALKLEANGYPGSFALASTIERFNMPTNLIGIVHDKSSWARRGLSVFNTVIEAGWRGYLTLELANHGPEELIIERGSPIAQIVFHYLDDPTEQPYVGKYQDQARGPQEAIEEK